MANLVQVSAKGLPLIMTTDEPDKCYLCQKPSTYFAIEIQVFMVRIYWPVCDEHANYINKLAKKAYPGKRRNWFIIAKGQANFK